MYFRMKYHRKVNISWIPISQNLQKNLIDALQYMVNKYIMESGTLSINIGDFSRNSIFNHFAHFQNDPTKTGCKKK